ncbi:ethylene-responsive transcription factor ERF [Forsythia ovata]|uniref:Ethylene-responsive transcription factor ERF n=1 Tax=Forsythia ovata TaxID=205694 RepID=A0ABD1SR77_9LAMI
MQSSDVYILQKLVSSEEAVVELLGDGSSANAQVNITSGNEFIDEEALFDMRNLLVGMAKGMLVSPPRMMSQPSDDSPKNSNAKSLWNHLLHQEHQTQINLHHFPLQVSSGAAE